ncbi:acyl-CoA carboxylase epsilon subunit [Streptomyces sp. NPDC052051]|uniref:acyl-CoA carboxylase epsilon subunit n=1 Tax=Streptomyces sp. NPDC052051 TaxID=3154649 RepID=UPI00342DFE5B
MSATDPHRPAAGIVRVLRGRPAPEELAAVLTVLTAALLAPGAPRSPGAIPERAPWSRRGADPGHSTSWRTP